ncbi:MAG: molybdopterin-dependent oxidoreductase [Stagnimonas sp.]|nr:molybdopterin-dependent oxidoreductase [Stagnimonas sp.]
MSDGGAPALKTTCTTCPYCGVGCGVLATPKPDGTVEIAGDPAHGANLGRLCVKGSALGETVGLEDRLLYPMLHREGVAQRASWDEALAQVAEGFKKTIAEHGPDAVAFYVSGQLLTEDYYVANKLMKGYIGSANIDTNSRLCMSSAVAGHKRAFGEDLVPGCYEDFEEADLVVLVGSNTAWCHPVLFQRLVAAKKARPEMQIVVIDPRHTATCELADLHLPLAPGSDVRLFNGLLAWLHEHGVMDAEFVEAHTEGADKAVALALQTGGSLAHVAKACKLSEEKLRQFYALWARTEKVVTAFSQGVNQSSSGTDKVNAIINCHLYTGRIGKPGATPFSITGQPNAMGGREVGGLANMLAAHLDIASPEHRALVQDFWQSPVIADQQGLKAVDLFEAIHSGKVKAVWIMATNPVVSLPDADRVREALLKCPLVVVSEVMARTDTADLAHVLLPALAWGEKDGSVTNSDRRISRQRAFLPVPGEAKADWWALAEVGKRMSFGESFEFSSAHEIFVEHAALTAYGNAGAGGRGQGMEAVPRMLNLAGLVPLTAEAYDDLQPLQWPVSQVPIPHPPSPIPASRLFSDGRFAHADGRARLLPLLPRDPVNKINDDWPLVLNTGRVRDHWHTMTRTGKSPKLADHTSEPFVEIHPQDAMGWGVQNDRLARVVTAWGSCVVRVRTTSAVARRQLFVPIHWNGTTASDARVGSLVNPVVDPISGEPEFKHTPARIEPFFVQWYGFVLSRQPLNETTLRTLPHLAWWTRVQGTQFIRTEFAGRGEPADWSTWAHQLLGASSDDPDWLDTRDASEGLYRGALIEGECLSACVFLSPRPEDLPARRWLSGLFAQESLSDMDRMSLLAGQAATPGVDAGATICSCFGIGRNPIAAAIREGCATPEALGAKLKCGTNCGSCVPELRQLIALVKAERQ